MSETKGSKVAYGNHSSSSNSNPSNNESSDSPLNYEDEAKSVNIANMGMNSEQTDMLLSRSSDIKRQLSQSLQGGGSHQHGGIGKPHSRKNSIVPVKSHGSDENDEDNDDLQGNERKRRDKINEKIQELLSLIPPGYFQESATNNNQTQKTNDSQQSNHEAMVAAAVKSFGTKDGKPNKGQVLTKSLEYIQALQNTIDENNRKEVELKILLKKLELEAENKLSDVPVEVGYTSAERALGEIGVGPLSDDYYKEVLVRSAGISKTTQQKSYLSPGSPK